MAKNTKAFADDFDYSDVSYKEEKKESVLYRPQAKDTKNGIYEAKLRFVPFLKEKDKSKHLVTLYCAYLKHSTLGSKTIQSYRSIGEDKRCKIVKTFFDCYYSEDARIKKKREMFKQIPEHYALVQILEDDVNPHLVGQIKIFKFGSKLKDLFDLEETPKKGEKRTPFNPYVGRVLSLYLTNVKDGNKEYNDYSKCSFEGASESEELPLLIDGKPIQDYGPEDRDFVKEWLISNSPDLSVYQFKEWDQDTIEYVDAVIQEQLGKGSTSAMLEDVSNGVRKTGGGFDDIDDDDDDDEPVVKKSTRSAPPAKTAPKKSVSLDDEDEEDDEDEIDYDADEKPLKKTSKPEPTKTATKRRPPVDEDDDEEEFDALGDLDI